MPGFEARVVDEDDVDVPDGTAGELLVRADEPFAFATGYWQLPDATAASWADGWFRTGDRVVRGDDGFLRFLDRAKDAIRRRGENISSWEVEQVLLGHPAVATAAVVPVPSELGEDDVMTFVVPRGGASVDPAELVAYCEPLLARFAIPRYVEVVDALPLTENGKVRKVELRTRGVGPATWDRERGGRAADAAREPTAVELLALLRRRELSARELAEDRLARVEAADAALNAVAHLDAEATLAEADAADRALAVGEPGALLGLTVSVKDSIAAAGWPCRSGSWARAGNVPEADATVVARVRAAGGVVLCKTTLPEYTWSTETESALHGRTRNPYDPERTSGGSSGGEAVLHAVDASPLGLGSDGFCSIRVPCHFCGTVGIRPTAGIVPETGVWPTTKDTGMLDMSTVGPMGRAVEDVALLLRVIAGPDDVDPFVSAAPVGDPLSVDVASLRVGLYTSLGHLPRRPAPARRSSGQARRSPRSAPAWRRPNLRRSTTRSTSPSR